MMGGRMRPQAGSNQEGNSSKNIKKTVKQLLVYSKKNMFLIITALVLAFSGTILSVIGPSKIEELTDLITLGSASIIDLDAVASIGIVLVFIYGFSFIFNYFQGFILASVNKRITKSLRKDIATKINKLPLKYFDSASTGDTLSVMTNDVDTIGQTFNSSLSGIVSSVTMIVGSTIMMFITNWILALSAISASIIGFVLMMIIMSKSQKNFVKQQVELGRLNGQIEETYTNHNVVRAYNGEANEKKKFQSINDELYDSAWKSQFASGIMQPLMSFIGNLGYVIVCIVGAILAMNGSISFGVIAAFLIYVRLFSQPLSQIAQNLSSMQGAIAAAERVFTFIDEKELTDETNIPLVKLGEIQKIEFKNVKFGYDPNKIIINDFSVSVNALNKIAIVGPTGAGKTTIVNLLMRFYEPNEGDITINDISIKDMSRSQVHDLFCMVLQDTWLFEGTIKENIEYPFENIDSSIIIDACKAVGLHHFIETLPAGYNTVLDDKTSLSEGQKQQLTLARALIKKSPLLILDEATSNVDTRTELIIQEAMDKLMENKTSFVIAHRLSTIKNADLILVMNNGDIIEIGNHEDLMTKGGFYKELYNSQFEMAN